MAFDPKIYRNTKDGIGSPSDSAATDSSSEWTIISLLKGLYAQFSTGIAVTPAQTDDAAFTVGTTKVMPAAGTYKSTRDSVDDNDAGALAMTAKRGLYVSPETPNGDSLVDDTNDLLKVATISGQNGVAAGGGIISAATQRVTIATDDGLHTKIGEVQASPTANTVLDRLKALLTGIVLAAGTNLIGRAVADASAATGGIASTARLLSAAASTNDTNVKGSAGRIYAIQGHNASTAFRYLKLYNKATAPTVGTDTPVKTIALPPSTSFALDWPHGYSFATGIGYGLTTAAADNDTGALTAGDVICLNVDYV